MAINISSPGNYSALKINSMGCDSTVTLTLQVMDTAQKVDNIINACPPYTFRTQIYTVSDTIIDQIQSVAGCDSLERWNILKIKSPPVTLPSLNYSFCDTIRLGSSLFSSSFSKTDTIRTLGTLQCDSIYQPRNYNQYLTPSIQLSTSTNDTFYYKGDNVTVIASSAQNYFWSTGDRTKSISFPIQQSQTIYAIAWSDSLCRDTAYINLFASDPTIVGFPTAFYPLSDKPENRTFKPNVNGKIESMKFDIYNRLGQKVYSNYSTQNLGWDGTFKGKPAPEGMYSYYIEFITNKRNYIRAGELMLRW